LTFDLNIPTLLSTHLDSEFVLWEGVDNALYEIHSRYPTETSRYTAFPLFTPYAEAHETAITLPFILIDFSNLEETIQRAQTMAVFS